MNQLKAVVIRFLKGAIAGAAASIGMVSYQTPAIWSDFSTILTSLGVAGTAGAIGGLILALQKWASWKEIPPVE